MSAEHEQAFNPTDRTLRQFGGLWLVFFLALAARTYGHQQSTFALVLAVLAVTIGPMGIVWPKAIRPVFVGWMKVAWPIGWVVSRVILGTIFYAIITPVAVVFRLAGRDLLGLRRQTGRATYWQPKPATTDKSRYLRQF